MADYKYPLYRQDDYKGIISFQVLELPPVTDVIAEQIGDQLDRINVSGGTSDQQQAAADLNSQDNINAHNGTLANQITQTSSNFNVIAREVCELYLPPNVQVSDGVSIENISLERSGVVAEAAIRGGSGLMRAGAEAIGDTINSTVDAIMSGGNILASQAAAVSAVTLANRVGNEVGAGVSSATGVAPNPNTRNIFKGVNLREFSFNFKLIPASQDESAEIKKIIRFFRSELYPDEIASTGTGASRLSFGYKFPNVFKIRMRYGDQQVATGIKPCYLRNFSTVYNGSQMGMYADGNFTEVDISLTFVETRTLRKADILGQGDGIGDDPGELF